MTDRELLEAAAIAAGDPIEGWTADADFVEVAILRSGARWQPLLRNRLTDCMGDALRLAVKLGVEVACDDEATHSAFAHARAIGCHDDHVFEPVVDDPCAATRRAIVRAAAAIGSQQA